ncbi:MAG: hypothetical protein V1735_03195 [Nanoarchaeota archaeon]
MARNLILFDIGGVLLVNTFSKFYEEAARQGGISPDDFKQAVIELEPDFTTDRISIPEYFHRLDAVIGRHLPDDEWKRIINLCWDHPVPETITLKQRLHEAGHAVGLFGDTPRLAHELLLRRYPEMFETFGGPQVFSYKVGYRKPASQMFEAVPTGYRVTLIEDKDSILTAAEAYGWQGILIPTYRDESEAIMSYHASAEQPRHPIARTAEEIGAQLSRLRIRV